MIGKRSTIREMVAARFMRSVSLSNVIESSIEYCAPTGSSGHWKFSISAERDHYYGQGSGNLFNIDVLSVRHVDNVKTICPDMSKQDPLIEIKIQMNEEINSTEFVAVFYHPFNLCVGFLTQRGFSRIVNDFDDDYQHLEKLSGNMVTNGGHWYIFDEYESSGDTTMIGYVSMMLSLMIEMSIGHEAAMGMMGTSK